MKPLSEHSTLEIKAQLYDIIVSLEQIRLQIEVRKKHMETLQQELIKREKENKNENT